MTKQTKLADELAEKILQTLEGQKFADWYNNGFNDYITGDMTYAKNITQDECKKLILGDIIRIFRIS